MKRFGSEEIKKARFREEFAKVQKKIQLQTTMILTQKSNVTQPFQA